MHLVACFICRHWFLLVYLQQGVSRQPHVAQCWLVGTLLKGCYVEWEVALGGYSHGVGGHTLLCIMLFAPFWRARGRCSSQVPGQRESSLVNLVYCCLVDSESSLLWPPGTQLRASSLSQLQHSLHFGSNFAFWPRFFFFFFFFSSISLLPVFFCLLAFHYILWISVSQWFLTYLSN